MAGNFERAKKIKTKLSYFHFFAEFNPVDTLDYSLEEENDPLHDLSKDLGLDLDLTSLLDGNNTDDNLGILLDTFTKEFGEEERVSDSVFYTLVIIYGVVISVGLVGNIVILYAILSKKGMRTARNYFILCLAFSDLLLCALTMPLTLWEVLRKVTESDLKAIRHFFKSSKKQLFPFSLPFWFPSSLRTELKVIRKLPHFPNVIVEQTPKFFPYSKKSPKIAYCTCTQGPKCTL